MKTLFKTFSLALLSAVVLTGCDAARSVLNKPTALIDSKEKQIQSFCLSAVILNKTIAKSADTLSLERLIQVKTVNDTIIYPICASEKQPEWEDLMIGRLEQAIGILKGTD